MKADALSLADFRAAFPALHQPHAPIYFDSAATSQKPQAVIDQLQQHDQLGHVNVHRGDHPLVASTTSRFEQARSQVQAFIGAAHSHEIIWTKGTTEGINLVAQAYAAGQLQPGDEIIVGEMEHHANWVPWLLLAQRTGAKLVVLPLTANLQYDLDKFAQYLSKRTKMVAIAQMSNVLGVCPPLREMVQMAHQVGAVVLVDGAQGIVHQRLDVVDLDIDFYVFSGHKLYAPTGIGVLYGKESLLNAMCPWQSGGMMIQQVTHQQVTFAELPYKFEAGTANISGVIGLGAAIQWLQQYDPHALEAHSIDLRQAALTQLAQLPQVILHGTSITSPFINFTLKGEHYQDVAMLLSAQNIMLRAGQHCAQPTMQSLGVAGTLRVSFAPYNTHQEVTLFIEAVQKTISLCR